MAIKQFAVDDDDDTVGMVGVVFVLGAHCERFCCRRGRSSSEIEFALLAANSVQLCEIKSTQNILSSKCSDLWLCKIPTTNKCYSLTPITNLTI